MRDRPTILVIDDQWGRPSDPMIPERYGRLPFEWRLESGEGSPGVHSVAKALATVKSVNPNVVLLDVMFGSALRLGVDILKAIREQFPLLPVLMFTSLDSESNRELVIECMEYGANEYLEKAPTAAKMEAVLRVYTDQLSDQAIYGNSAMTRRLRAEVARVSFSSMTSVLIYGESGTGKELVASALHRQGSRSESPFVAKNCAHSDSQLLESELFGHMKGAFTGAFADRRGLVEEAHGGVLFLDEVADIPVELQGKLLRILETRHFRRLGRNVETSSDFQLLCATNQEPHLLEKSGRLRPDFYYRISAMTLRVPTLRERLDDLPILAQLFLRRLKERGAAGYPGQVFSPESMRRLAGYSWPGNIRELRNVVERSLILSRGPEIHAEIPSNAPLLLSQDGNMLLPEDAEAWAKSRLVAELRLCVEAKHRIRLYKGDQWRAEFMRLMYPECRAASAKGFADLIKRLTNGPWGKTQWKEDPEISSLIKELVL